MRSDYAYPDDEFKGIPVVADSLPYNGIRFRAVKPAKFAASVDTDISKRLCVSWQPTPAPVLMLREGQTFAQRWSYRTSVINNLWDICWKFLNLKIGKGQ